MNDMPNQSNDMHLPQPVVDSNAQIPAAAPAVPQTAATQQPHPLVAQSRGPQAQDKDVIEPEWVHAVERLMRQKIEDPRALATELSTLKAQYMHKRFGKAVKSPSGAGQA